MADAMHVDDGEKEMMPDPIVPHKEFSKDDLETFFPSIRVPDAVDAEDPFNDVIDPILEQGMKTAGDMVQACSEQGRRRKMV